MARIAGINIPQNKVVSIALTYIHGIGLHSSKKICSKLGISSSKRVNELSEEQVLKIREFIDANHVNHPPNPGIPVRLIHFACAELICPTSPASIYFLSA